MKVCYFGIYNPQYPRNAILIKGLREHGVEVVECNTRMRGMRKYFYLFRRYRTLGHFDVMIIGFPAHAMAPFARLLAGRRIMVSDAFVSLYNTNVLDRARANPGSVRAFFWKVRDYITARLSDMILLDTNAHIDYYHDLTALPKKKFKRVFAGVDPQEFYPTGMPPSRFIVHFHGHLVPFHGIEVILEAASLLRSRRDISFRIITRVKCLSPHLAARMATIPSLEVLDEVERPRLNTLLNEASVVLGAFGVQQKRELVIPNKLFEGAAVHKPLITGFSSAVGELFRDGVECVMVPPNDPAALVEAILSLKNDPTRARELAMHAYQVVCAHATPAILGRALISVISPITTS